MNPLNLSAGISSTSSLIRSARALIEDLRALAKRPDLVADEVLRTLYLDVEFNLRVLEVLPSNPNNASSDPAYFAYAPLLRTDAMLALLMEWPAERRVHVSDLVRRQSNWERMSEALDEQTLVGLCRKVLIACQALQAISSVPAEARNRTRIRQRLLNVKAWLRLLHAVLREHPSLRPLTQPGQVPS